MTPCDAHAKEPGSHHFSAVLEVLAKLNIGWFMIVFYLQLFIKCILSLKHFVSPVSVGVFFFNTESLLNKIMIEF